MSMPRDVHAPPPGIAAHGVASEFHQVVERVQVVLELGA